MAGEWVRSTWDFSPIGLGHTGSTIVKAFHSLLTQCGWELAPWDALDDDRAYLRADRATSTVTNTVNGAIGSIAKVGANITVSTVMGTGSTKTVHTVNLTGIPADTNTITISDGTLTKTYEFDSNSTVTGGNVAVTIQPTRTRTMEAFIAALNAAGQAAVAAALTKRWRFNGDGVEVDGGIRVRWDTGNSRVAINTFLANNTEGAIAYEVATEQEIRIAYNMSLVNSYTLFAGEDGLFFECGTQGSVLPQNLAHGAIATFTTIPEFHGTKDDKITWTAQGMVMNLFGSPLAFGNWDYRFVDNAGAGKNYTAALKPHVPRGTTTLAASTQSTDNSYFILPRDNMIGLAGGTAGTPPACPGAIYYAASFGLINSPVDDRYKLSPIWMLQHTVSWATAANDGAATINVAPSVGYGVMLEVRWIRQINRFVACDQTLLPFNNITDSITSKVYRITQLADGGRTTNLAVEYPSTAVTIPATPAT